MTNRGSQGGSNKNGRSKNIKKKDQTRTPDQPIGLTAEDWLPKPPIQKKLFSRKAQVIRMEIIDPRFKTEDY